MTGDIHFDRDPAGKGDIGGPEPSSVYSWDEYGPEPEFIYFPESVPEPDQERTMPLFSDKGAEKALVGKEARREDELDLIGWVKFRYPFFFRDLQAVQNHVTGHNVVTEGAPDTGEGQVVPTEDASDEVVESKLEMNQEQKEEFGRLMDMGQFGAVEAEQKARAKYPAKKDILPVQEIVPDNISSFVEEIRGHCLSEEYGNLNGMCARIVSASSRKEISTVEAEVLLRLIGRCLPPSPESS